MRTSEKMLRPTKGATLPHFMNSRMKNEFAYSHSIMYQHRTKRSNAINRLSSDVNIRCMQQCVTPQAPYTLALCVRADMHM